MKDFCLENEENNIEESLNNYKDIFRNYSKNFPTLEEALVELFMNSGAKPNEANNIYKNLNDHCKIYITKNFDAIKQNHPMISENDALVICSYTYEIEMYKNYAPFCLLNKNLVNDNRKKGIQNIEKYLFLLLTALRKMQKVKKNKLFRCLKTKVKTEKVPEKPKFVPYKKGNKKTFWNFISTSYDEETANNFLDGGEGTQLTIIGDNLWGYDITLFNYFKESEILLEPENKYIIENVQKGNVTKVICKIIDNIQPLLDIIPISEIKCKKCGSNNIKSFYKKEREYFCEKARKWDKNEARNKFLDESSRKVYSDKELFDEGIYLSILFRTGWNWHTEEWNGNVFCKDCDCFWQLSEFKPYPTGGC